MKLREHSFLLGFFFFMITIASIIFYESSYIETNIEFRIFYFLGFIVSVILIVGIIGIANDERNGRPSKAIKLAFRKYMESDYLLGFLLVNGDLNE